MKPRIDNYYKNIKTIFYSSLVMILILGYPGMIMAQYSLYVWNGGKFYVNGMMPDTVPTCNAPEISIALAGSEIINTGRMRTWHISTFGPTSRYTSTGEDQLSCANFTVNSVGTVFIHGNGILNFGNLVHCNLGYVGLGTPATCKTLTFKTNYHISLNSTNVVLTVNGDEDAVKNYGPPNRVIVLNSTNTKFTRRIDTVDQTYEFPIAYVSTSGQLVYRRIDVKPLSLGSTGAGYVTAVTRKLLPGTISYYRTFPTGFSNVGGMCVPGNNPQDFALSCKNNEGWKLTGPNDYESVVTGYPQLPCGAYIRRLLQSRTDSVSWQASIEDVAGNLATSFCSYSTWGTSAAVVGGAYKGFGYFVAAGGSVTGLPVELVSFNAKPVDNQYIQLDWETAMEINNDKFIVARSTDGQHFEQIGEVAGNGNSTDTHTYSLDDYDVDPDIVYYYRLTQVDYDGNTEDFEIVSAYVAGHGPGIISIFPNPMSNKTIIRTTGDSEISGTVYSIMGDRSIDIPAGKQFEIDLTGYPNGIYIADIHGTDFHQQFKILKVGN